MRLGGVILLLVLVGIVASLEASPTPIPLRVAGTPVLEGYELLVVWTSQEGYEDLVSQALKAGVNVLIVADRSVELPYSGVVERVGGRAIAVLVLQAPGGVERIVLNTTPTLGVPLESMTVKPSGPTVGIVVDVEHRRAYYFYMEQRAEQARLAVLTHPEILETRLGEKLLERLAPNGRIAWGAPETRAPSILALFHPATLLAFLSSMVKSIEAAIEDPYMRVSYALLGIGLGLASLLPLLAGVDYGAPRALELVAKTCRGRGRLTRILGPEKCIVEED